VVVERITGEIVNRGDIYAEMNDLSCKEGYQPDFHAPKVMLACTPRREQK